MKSVVADFRYKVMCLRIAPKTGSPIYLTHYVRDLVVSGHTYLSSSGYEFTGFSSTSAFSPGVIDLDGIAGLAGIGYDQVASGVFDGARCYLFATTWNSPIEDDEPIASAILGKTTFKDKQYTIEVMSLVDTLNQSKGRTYTVGCPNTFGGQDYGGCKINLGPITVTGTITHVSGMNIVRDSARTEAFDYFGAGTIQFTSGANAGLKPLEIKRHEADGTVEIFDSFHYQPSVGDAYTMIPGCRGRLEDCRDKWNNIINRGGFDWIPTGSTYAQRTGN